MSRTRKPLVLDADQATHLQGLLRRSKLQQRVARRCRVLLFAAEGMSNVDIGAEAEPLIGSLFSSIMSRFAFLGSSNATATRHLQEFARFGALAPVGGGRGTRYELPET